MLFKPKTKHIKETIIRELEPQEEALSYEEYLSLSKYSINTIKIYMMYKNLLRNNMTQDGIDRFCSRHNHQVARSFLRSYLEFLKIRDINIPRIRGRKQKRILNYLEYEDYLAFVDAVAEPRNQIMLRLMFESGLRISELLALTPSNFNMDKNEVRGIGKGNKEFCQNFKDKTREMIVDYVNAGDFDADSRIFPISRQYAWKFITKDSMDFFGRKIHPHALRHSCGTYLRRKGWDLKDIQIYLRHEKLETTGVYTHVDKQDVERKFKGMEDGE